MKKQTLLLSALALSIGLSLSVLPPAAASLPTQVPGQGALPSLAPMLEKVLPAVVSVQVEGTASPTLNVPEELKTLTWEDYLEEGALTAIDEVRSHAGFLALRIPPTFADEL